MIYLILAGVIVVGFIFFICVVCTRDYLEFGEWAVNWKDAFVVFGKVMALVIGIILFFWLIIQGINEVYS